MAKKVMALFINVISDMPEDIRKDYRSDIEWRNQNDTCIMWDEKYFDTDSKWQNWLLANFDLSDVVEIVIDHSW